jgi:hypothetical protein
MNHQDNLREEDHANIALYSQKTLWNEALTKDYLIPSQVAELYHVDTSTVYRWIKEVRRVGAYEIPAQCGRGREQ